ncbi:MAG: sigma-70 family RNA polymerase sigma factor [Tannerella sp.]|jgi:RNA polymerase sigma-70 factor (ECF subfamily)|nr:sigma-70 family RNA polymerase sigma factor [Tannerella sp.]
MTSESFKEKYFSLHKKLYRVAFAILDNEEDAEDIVQETYCKLWDKRLQLVAVESPEAYSVTMVKNLCMDFLDKHKMLRIDDMKESEFQPVSDRFEEDFDSREMLDRVKIILKTLPEKQHKVLKLSCFAGYGNEEIEKITGESAANVRILLMRAKNTVKEKLKLKKNEYQHYT